MASSAVDRVLAALPAFGPWWIDIGDGAIRVRIAGVVTCPVCAAAGATGTWFWEYAEALGLTALDAIALAEAADGGRTGPLRDRLLAVCSLAAQTELPL